MSAGTVLVIVLYFVVSMFSAFCGAAVVWDGSKMWRELGRAYAFAMGFFYVVFWSMSVVCSIFATAFLIMGCVQ